VHIGFLHNGSVGCKEDVGNAVAASCKADPSETAKQWQGLPKYSPDLNPIEMSYGKLKAAQSRRANRSGPLRDNSQVRAPSQATRMRKLLQVCRLCFQLSGNRFRAKGRTRPMNVRSGWNPAVTRPPRLFRLATTVTGPRKATV
jgi:hypothetical protein